MVEKKWEIKGSKRFKGYKGFRGGGLDEIVSALLENRGLTSEKEVEEFLNPTPPSEIELSQFGIARSDLENAVNLIKSAIERGAPIIIHGDFDVDGICGAAILWEAIYRGLEYENCLPFIPDRFKHGYGLTRASVDAIAAKLPSCRSARPERSRRALLVTVDCGITAHEAVRYAKSLGFEVLVTDHHQREGTEGSEGTKGTDVLWTDKICGAGIAWLLAQKLVKECSHSELGSESETLKQVQGDGGGGVRGDEISSLDLIALATIADIQPLLGPNRSFAKYGLTELNRTRRIGLQELVKVARLEGRETGTYEVGWMLAPRLNAAGRLGDAMDSLRLLLTKDRTQARALAEKLDQVNRKRQEKTDEMVALALEETRQKQMHLGGQGVEREQKVLIISHELFHEGVIGLLAGKLVEEFYRPSVALSRGEEFSKGSARSISGFNIVEALRETEDLLESVGGHPMAAGFTIRTEKISEFQVRFLELVDSRLNEEALQPILTIDLEIPLSPVSWELWEKIKGFEPFGCANPRPKFLSRGVGVIDVSAVGSEGQHLKLKLQNIRSDPLSNPFKSVFSAIGFGMGDWAQKLHLGDIIDIVYSLEENKWSARGGWGGRRSLELKLKDLRASEES